MDLAAKEKAQAMFVTKGGKLAKASHRTARVTAVNFLEREELEAAHEKAYDAKAAEKAAEKEVEQAIEAALRKNAIYEQKTAAWKRWCGSIQAKADAKKAKEKAALKESTNNDLLKEGPLECPSEKGPLETQERRPPVQVCQQDLEARPTTEPNKKPTHGRNDDL